MVRRRDAKYVSGAIDGNTGSSLYSRVGMIHMSIPSRAINGPSTVSKRFLIHGVTIAFCSRCVSTRSVGYVWRATALAVADVSWASAVADASSASAVADASWPLAVADASWSVVPTPMAFAVAKEVAISTTANVNLRMATIL